MNEQQPQPQTKNQTETDSSSDFVQAHEVAPVGQPPEGLPPSRKRILVIGTALAVFVVVVAYLMARGGDGDSASKPFFSAGCEEAYEELLSANAFDFTHCTDAALRSGSFEAGEVGEKTNNMVLVFDASGSMAGTVPGGKKIDVAKDATKKFLADVEGDASLALSVVVYGHKGSNDPSQKSLSCRGIEEIIALGPVDSESAAARIDSFNATGWTPIADSLIEAEEIMSADPADANIVLLVSDGIETCDGDPVAEARRLRAEDPSIVTSVIGFDVSGDDESQLEEIARAGGGDYYSVKTAQELAAVFAQYEQVLAEADFAIGRTIEQIYDAGYVTHTYNQCQMGLRREEAAMMLDIHVSELAGKSCVTYADGAYRERFNEIESRLRSQYEAALREFDALR